MATSRRAEVRAWTLLAAMFLGLVLALFDNQHRGFDPPWLLVPLNAVFLTVVPLAVAWLAVPAYRSTGVTAILAIGAGMLAVGVGGGAVPGVLRYVTGPNANVTMHNNAVLLAGLAQVAAAVLSVVMLAPRDAQHRTRDVVAAYSLVIAVLAAVLVLVQVGWAPTFFTSADGATVVRQIVLGSAVELFAVAGVVWALTYVRTRLPFARLYVMGLGLFTLGLTAVFFQHNVGNVVGWVGRAGQYAGALYFLAAVIQAGGARSHELSNRAMGMTLAQPAVRLQPLVESTADAITVLDGDRVMYANEAARRMFGYSPADLFGERLLDLVAPESSLPDSHSEIAQVLATGTAGRHWEGELRARSGHRFPAELSLYAYTGGSRRVCVIRDVTERAEAQRALQDAHRELERRALQLEQAERLAQLGSWQWDARTDQATGSAQMYEIAGIGPDNPLTMSEAIAALHIVDRDQALAIRDRAMASEEPFEISQQLTSPNGEVRDVLTRGEVVRDGSGAVVGLRGTMQDVTTLRRAEKVAAEARRRMADEALRERQRAERERYAREVNDSIVQGLVAAEIALDRHEGEYARQLIGETSHQARHWIGELLASEGPLRPGAARRSTPADRRRTAHR